MPTVDQHLDELTVACQQLIETVGDLRVRGYLKDHPDDVAHSAGLVEAMLAEVRTAVEKERQSPDIRSLPSGEAARAHASRAAEYGAHRCRCGWCLHAA